MANVFQTGFSGVDIGLLETGIVTNSSASIVEYDLGSGQSARLIGTFAAFDPDGRPTAGLVKNIEIFELANSLTINLANSEQIGVDSFNAYVEAGDTIAFLTDILAGSDQISGSGAMAGYAASDLIVVADLSQVDGGEGNDIIRVRRSAIVDGSSFVGGDGVDSVVVDLDNSTYPDLPPFARLDIVSLSGFERLVVASAALISNTVQLTYAQLNVFTNIAGDDGEDTVIAMLPSGGGSYTLGLFGLTNWSTNDTLGISVGAGTGDYTLTASYHAAGTYLLDGGAGNDQLFGSTRADRLLGRGGNDLLLGGGDNDFLDGGDGIDTASYAGAVAGVTVALAVTGQRDTGGAGLDTLRNIENVIGSAHADTLIGTSAANVIDGAGGADIMRGLLGDDTYLVNDAADRVQEAVGTGTDTIHTTITRGLAANVEHLLLLGSAAINGFGNALANSLTGNSGANLLNGGAGNDILRGNAGADRLIGGLGRDVLYGGADSDADMFIYRDIAESTIGANRDPIHNFTSGIDTIDLRAIDANANLANNQAFAFSATGPAAHSIWVVDIGAHLIVRGDVSGDTAADFEFQLMNTGAVLAGDFLL